MIVWPNRLPWEVSVQQTGLYALAKKRSLIYILSNTVNGSIVETNQEIGCLTSTWSPLQVRPTSPEILAAEISEGRWDFTSSAVGTLTVSPIIVVRFHRSTVVISGK